MLALSASGDHRQSDPTRPHNNVAYERFTDEGPMALLPRAGGSCAMVWTMPEQQARERMELVDDDSCKSFRSALATVWNVLVSWALALIPCSCVWCVNKSAHGLVVLGNAAPACIRWRGRVLTSRCAMLWLDRDYLRGSQGR